jgi:hypothetical protein
MVVFKRQLSIDRLKFSTLKVSRGGFQRMVRGVQIETTVLCNFTAFLSAVRLELDGPVLLFVDRTLHFYSRRVFVRISDCSYYEYE